MSLRVSGTPSSCVPLAGTHWSYLPPFQAACVSVQPCGGSSRNCHARGRARRVERQHARRCRRAGATPARPSAASPGAGRRSRARRAACRSSGRTSGSPASGRRCARRPRWCPCGGARGSPARLLDVAFESGGERAGAEELQECSAIGAHGWPPDRPGSTARSPAMFQLADDPVARARPVCVSARYPEIVSSSP